MISAWSIVKIHEQYLRVTLFLGQAKSSNLSDWTANETKQNPHFTKQILSYSSGNSTTMSPSLSDSDGPTL